MLKNSQLAQELIPEGEFCYGDDICPFWDITKTKGGECKLLGITDEESNTQLFDHKKECGVKMKPFIDTSDFCGTEGYTRIFPKVLITDGAKSVAEELKCYWALTDAGIYANMELKNEEFLVIKLEVDDNSKAILTIDDGNNNILHEQSYATTDCAKSFKLYGCRQEDGLVIMVPEEY